MDNLLSNLALLQAGAPATGGLDIWSLLPFAGVILIFYFMIIRPQNKKQKETERMLKELKKGDKVVTIGGLRGEVQDVKDDTIVIKVDPDSNTKLEFNRSAVASLVQPPVPQKDAKKDDKKEDKKEDKKS